MGQMLTAFNPFRFCTFSHNVRKELIRNILIPVYPTGGLFSYVTREEKELPDYGRLWEGGGVVPRLPF